MAHLMLVDSMEEDIFVCGLCKSVFNSLQIFLEHKRLVCGSILGENVLTTIEPPSAMVIDEAECGNLLQSPQPALPCGEFTDVIEVPTEIPKEYICIKCKKKFRKEHNLRIHMKVHHERPFQCPICGRCLTQNSHLQRHIESHKMWPDGLISTTPKNPSVDLLSYSCSFCDLIFPNYSQYRSHLKNHLSLKKYKCVQWNCMEFHDSVDNLLQHVAIEHMNPIYSCHICSSTFDTLEDIATHQTTHNDPAKDVKFAKLRYFKCSECDAMFRKSETLAQHMLTENHQRICIHCNKTFSSDKRLRLHLQIHRNSKPYHCNICNSSFHVKKYLATHMLRHGIKKYKCTVCNKMFKRPDMLSRHMRIHQTKKMFPCPFKDSMDCMKEFSRRDKLKAHVKHHTKEMAKSKKNKK